MPLHAADPAHRREDDRYRLLGCRGFERSGEIDLRRILKGRATTADFGFRPEDLARVFQLLADLGPLAAGRAYQRFNVGLLCQELIMLGLDLHLFELAEGPQAKVQNGFCLRIR